MATTVIRVCAARGCVGTVPAQIVNSLSSADVTVQEGDSVSLVCHVTGIPEPEVRWHRKQVVLLPESTAAQRSMTRRGGEYTTCQLLGGIVVASLCMLINRSGRGTGFE